MTEMGTRHNFPSQFKVALWAFVQNATSPFILVHKCDFGFIPSPNCLATFQIQHYSLSELSGVIVITCFSNTLNTLLCLTNALHRRKITK